MSVAGLLGSGRFLSMFWIHGGLRVLLYCCFRSLIIVHVRAQRWFNHAVFILIFLTDHVCVDEILFGFL